VTSPPINTPLDWFTGGVRYQPCPSLPVSVIRLFQMRAFDASGIAITSSLLKPHHTLLQFGQGDSVFTARERARLKADQSVFDDRQQRFVTDPGDADLIDRTVLKLDIAQRDVFQILLPMDDRILAARIARVGLPNGGNQQGVVKPVHLVTCQFPNHSQTLSKKQTYFTTVFAHWAIFSIRSCCVAIAACISASSDLITVIMAELSTTNSRSAAFSSFCRNSSAFSS
jgi:hypothetical protein